MNKPLSRSDVVRTLYEDEIFPINRRVVGPNLYRINQTWVETPEGYAWSPDVQPVRNQPHQPILRLPETSLGEGMWAEVRVPYVDLTLANPPARAPWLVNRLATGLPPRFFYSQIAWIDQVEIDENDQVLYRVNERYGYGDLFWAPAEAFRPLTPEEMTPLSPDVEEKRILVNINRQTMSCFEGNTEVYFARVSTGALYNIQGERVDEWGTPPGQHRISNRLLYGSGVQVGSGVAGQRDVIFCCTASCSSVHNVCR